MKLMTEISIPELPVRIDHHTRILMMGSCFTDHIGSRMKNYLFPVLINPFGVTYNPLSVHHSLSSLMDRPSYTEDDLGFHNELWFSFDHYTGYSSTEKQETLDKINADFTRGKQFLREADFLILTFGTAWVYYFLETGQVVCNCHKIPAKEFRRTRLSVEEIVTAYRSLTGPLLSLNNRLKILFTVSPVRHWKDGAHGNQLSKSTLLLAIDEIVQSYPDRYFYFPSYEIMMDELRDYRYYARDLIHPGELAVDYIWEKFRESCLAPESREIINQLEPVLQMIRHKPFRTGTVAYQKWIRHREDTLVRIKNQYPFLSWENLDE